MRKLLIALLFVAGTLVPSPVASQSLPEDLITEMAGATFPPEVSAWVARIAWCESRWQPGVDTNWPYVGLMQVDYRLHAWRLPALMGRPVTVAESHDLLQDPWINLWVANQIRLDQGWSAWPVCSRA